MILQGYKAKMLIHHDLCPLLEACDFTRVQSPEDAVDGVGSLLEACDFTRVQSFQYWTSGRIRLLEACDFTRVQSH